MHAAGRQSWIKSKLSTSEETFSATQSSNTFITPVVARKSNDEAVCDSCTRSTHRSAQENILRHFWPSFHPDLARFGLANSLNWCNESMWDANSHKLM